MYLTKNQFGRNEICCAEDNSNYMSKMCEKEFSDSNFDLEVIGKISIFQEIAPNFTYLEISQFFKHNYNFLDQLLLPYNFHGSSMRGILFFNFASCELLI